MKLLSRLLSMLRDAVFAGHRPALLLALLCAPAYAHLGHDHDKDQPAAVRHWQLDSFLDFSAGTFDDAGANAYVAADGSIRLINQWDLNADGHVDLLLPNSHGHNEITDAFVFWDRERWDPAKKFNLPSNGGKTGTAGDLNNDGWIDLVMVNRFNGTKSELDLWIYWGSAKGFSPEKRSALPGNGAEAAAIADLNGDGYPEIVVANSGLSYHVSYDSFGKSPIFWNRAGKFSADDRTDLPTAHATDVAIADVSGDKQPDIVFAQEGNEGPDAGLKVYFNDRGRFDQAKALHLPGERSNAVAVGDLNRDGRIDLVVSNAYRLKDREGGIYNIVETTHLNSCVYWNSANGLNPAARTLLPTVGAQDVAVGDVDRNGWPDLVFAQSGPGASFLYWGGAEGFSPQRRKAIGGGQHGLVELVDLDGNGCTDLILSRRGSGGSYKSEALVYWGDADGLQFEKPLVLPAENPGGVVAADFDRNGMKDLVVINRVDGNDGPETPAFIYPGNGRGFDAGKMWTLPTNGADAYLSSDLNADGFVDVFFAHRPPTIFWGGKDAIGRNGASTVAPDFAFSGRAADFNRDGYLDLALSEWTPGKTGTHIYYGGPGGYSTSYRQAFPLRSVRFHTVADFNSDGWLDLAYPNFIDQQVVIYWNGPLGFDAAKPTILPVRSAVALEVADLNRDGHIDLIVPNLFNKNPEPGKPRSFGGSPQGDTFVFWGSPEGPKPERRTVLPAVGVEDAAVGDLNRDGHLDLVLSSYHAGETRSHPSYIYWGGEKGLDPAKVTMLPTHSASGVLLADFNRDGWPDIYFANHSKDGNHRTDTWIYWGGKEGFSEKRRDSLPGHGPHLLTVVDIGHIRDRSDKYAYISKPFPAGHPSRIERVEWKASTPFRTAVRLQVRAAETAEALATAEWQGPSGPGSYFTQSGESQPRQVQGSWLQFRAELVSPDSANSPVLESVLIAYRQ